MADPRVELVVVTGMTGAGRSTAAKVLEDLGFFVVDNLPPQLLAHMVKLVTEEAGGETRIVVVVDVRSRWFFTELRGSLAEMRESGVRPWVLYLEASDEVLVRRQEAARRPHPLQGGGRLLDGIAHEREMLRDLRGDADLIVDTSSLNVHQLAAKVLNAFSQEGEVAVRATVVSFGFKYGIPVDADLVVDMRFLPNPHWVPELRPHTGLEKEVSDYVIGHPDAKQFLDRYEELLRTLAAGYLREGKRYITVAVGCTGGKHRSIAMAEALAERMRANDIPTLVTHRDLGRE
ncbi:MAG TPA: RNase adapter RapZ [Nocardioidaceae bacterium]|jgi:RNase adapter protein RapZ|nr:RNase adapter RapZ [Nocardioidaceae bacterium]